MQGGLNNIFHLSPPPLEIKTNIVRWQTVPKHTKDWSTHNWPLDVPFDVTGIDPNSCIEPHQNTINNIVFGYIDTHLLRPHQKRLLVYTDISTGKAYALHIDMRYFQQPIAYCWDLQTFEHLDQKVGILSTRAHEFMSQPVPTCTYCGSSSHDRVQKYKKQKNSWEISVNVKTQQETVKEKRIAKQIKTVTSIIERTALSFGRVWRYTHVVAGLLSPLSFAKKKNLAPVWTTRVATFCAVNNDANRLFNHDVVIVEEVNIEPQLQVIDIIDMTQSMIHNVAPKEIRARLLKRVTTFFHDLPHAVVNDLLANIRANTKQKGRQSTYLVNRANPLRFLIHLRGDWAMFIIAICVVHLNIDPVNLVWMIHNTTTVSMTTKDPVTRVWKMVSGVCSPWEKVLKRLKDGIIGVGGALDTQTPEYRHLLSQTDGLRVVGYCPPLFMKHTSLPHLQLLRLLIPHAIADVLHIEERLNILSDKDINAWTKARKCVKSPSSWPSSWLVVCGNHVRVSPHVQGNIIVPVTLHSDWGWFVKKEGLLCVHTSFDTPLYILSAIRQKLESDNTEWLNRAQIILVTRPKQNKRKISDIAVN